MRDLVVRQGLEAMAREAAVRLRELVAAGDEIPYDLREAGDGSLLTRYEPLTARFVRDHAAELKQLEGFGVACAALESASLAAPYLEQMGIAPPTDSRRRAELAGTVFLCRLWADSTDFSLDRERLDEALGEVEAAGSPAAAEIDVVVPLRGFVMNAVRLELPMASIVRADAVEGPSDASSVQGLGASPWDPTFLAVARVRPEDETDGAAEVGARAVESLRALTTTLRLFADGGVSLGPHAWTRAAGDRWRRISTGAGKPRPGGYRLRDEELAELRAFARALSRRWDELGRAPSDTGFGAIARAISRFEAGLERAVVVEALSDYLLSLRFLLEGAGPAQLGISMRVAALCAEPGEREPVRAVVERGLSLERELWSGEPAASSGLPPAEVALELEDLTRAILKDAACGQLGSDLRATADEILLADGLTVGEGSLDHRGETAEWQPGDSEPEAEAEPAVEGDPEAELEAELVAQSEPENASDGMAEPADPDPELESRRLIAEQPTQAYVIPGIHEEPEPEPEPAPKPIDLFRASRERIAERAELQVSAPEARSPLEQVSDRNQAVELEEDEVAHRAEAVSSWRAAPEPPREPERSAETGSSPVFELIERTRAERQSRQERVAELFPRPEPCEWNVRELAYARRSRG